MSAQGILLLLRRLRWPSFLLVHGEDAVSKDASAELLRLAAAAPDMCVQRRVLELAEDGRGDSDVAWAISKGTIARMPDVLAVAGPVRSHFDLRNGP